LALTPTFFRLWTANEGADGAFDARLPSCGSKRCTASPIF
jgi:hypothetical protein